MKFLSSIKKAFLLVLAWSIIWISLGSLINFHQHKIWGRHLIPQICAYLPGKDKSDHSQFKVKPQAEKSFRFVYNPDAEISSFQGQVQVSSFILSLKAFSGPVFSGISCLPASLRAPPAC
jgi:hypothetical protein